MHGGLPQERSSVQTVSRPARTRRNLRTPDRPALRICRCRYTVHEAGAQRVEIARENPVLDHPPRQSALSLPVAGMPPAAFALGTALRAASSSRQRIGLERDVAVHEEVVSISPALSGAISSWTYTFQAFALSATSISASQRFGSRSRSREPRRSSSRCSRWRAPRPRRLCLRPRRRCSRAQPGCARPRCARRRRAPTAACRRSDSRCARP